jgi:hypothetical protein
VEAKAAFLVCGSGPNELAETDIMQIVGMLASSTVIFPLSTVSRRETGDENVEVVGLLLLLISRPLSIA